MEPNLEAERRIEEARRTRAETLDLGDLALRELPASLGELPDLRRLFLGIIKATEKGLELEYGREIHLKDLTNLSALSGLAGLQSLDLWSTGVTDLSPLSGLSGLQSLELRSTGVTDLSPLSRLSGLQRLNLGRTGVTDLSPLSDLSSLQSLDLSSTGVTDLSALSGLAGLQRLYLERTGVTDLSALAGLAGLQSLVLGSTGVTDLSPLSGLGGLQSLNLANTGVTDLSWLSGLAGLQDLDLAGTGVTNLFPLSDLSGLQSLDLWSTGVTDLSPLSGLIGIQSLNLWSTGVADLSPLLGLIGLQSLYLYGCTTSIPEGLLRNLTARLRSLSADKAAGVPREVLSVNELDDCLPRLKAFLAELDVAAETENEVKVILLGNGRVGKTQLCRRFRSEPFDGTVPSTHGVQVWREKLRLRTGTQDQDFQVNWWDFGGQDIYHGTHALFLRSRAVFLILWSPRLENRDEYEENGIPLRNQTLAYWLDYVRSLAGEDSAVIVVQSQCDTPSDRRSDPPRPAGAGFFECCAYSAKNDRGRETLEVYLREAIRYLRERTGLLQIGRGRAKVRQQLYDWRQEDQPLKPEERQHRTLSFGDFRALCDETGGIVSWEHALDYLHQTGVVFYDAKLFSDRIVLDQDWALDAVYSVFHRGKTVPWLRESGRFTREDLAATVWREHSVEEQKLFLGLMTSCGVCFPCGKTSKGEERYIAPDLLPGFEAFAGRRHVLDSWKEEAETSALRLEYRFFHPAIMRGLMSRIGREAGDLAEYWKLGLWLKDGRRDSQLLVQFEDISTHEAPGAGALVLKAQGRDPLGLLREIRKAIHEQRLGEEPVELLTRDGVRVDWSLLGREEKPGDKISIKPEPVNAAEKECPEVFISYAWGDDSPEGRTLGEVVDRLYEALEKDGFRPVRDSKAMKSGELISAFMRRISRGDLVVAVISDKYLRSPYCMDEIHGLWQKSQEDAALMAERLVPIVLPEVRIERLRDRAPYLKYWQAQFEEMQELQRDLGPQLSPQSQREFRLVRNFAQDVDGILVFLKDVLMPRKLEVHLDDGFEVVRGALRWRMGVEL